MSNYEIAANRSPQVNNPAVLRINPKKLYSVFLGILPLCMYYKFPFLNLGFSTVMSAAFLPYILYALITKREKLHINVFLVVYFLYVIFRSTNSISNMLLMSIALLHIFAAARTVDYSVCRKTIVTMSVVASLVVIVQKFFSVFGLNISFFIAPLMLDEFKEVTSVLSGEELTRLSGLFAEPSHFAEYVLIGLIFIVMDRRSATDGIDFKCALLITFAIVLTTSGIGLLGAAAVWAYYILINAKPLQRYPMFLRVFILVVIALVALLILYMIPVTRLALSRIFGWVDGYNAVLGRSLHTPAYLNALKGSLMAWGVGFTEPEHFLVGYVRIIFLYGVVGLCLLAAGLLGYLLRGSKEVRTMCLLYIGFLLATGLVGFLNYTFYFTIIVCAFSYENQIKCAQQSTHK